MRWALLADIHGNLEALRTVLAHVDRWPGARIVVAGDIVGYGPDPEACIALLEERGALCVAGNHEGMVLGRIAMRRCNYAGITAVLWTRGALSPRSRDWIAALPASRLVADRLLLCHGDPRDPERYVDSPEKAREVLAAVPRREEAAVRVVCGHTHRATCYREGGSWDMPRPEGPIHLERDRPYLINPGSVGQARYEPPLSRYARYDDEEETIAFYTLPYDTAAVRRKLRRARLVPRVSMPAETRLGRRLERLQTRWARWRWG